MMLRSKFGYTWRSVNCVHAG